MKWVIFTGTWRLTNAEVENNVRQAARLVSDRGDGLITGGATGVDYFAMDEFLKFDPGCTKMKIFIPAKLDHFIADYRKNWKHSPIDDEAIDKLAELLNLIKAKNPEALIEAPKNSGDVTQDDNNLRHNDEVSFADEVFAFQVNESTGTKDTIDKAKKAGLPITLHKTYTIAE